MKYIYLFNLVLPTKVFPFTNHVFEFVFQKKIIKILLGKKFKYFSFEMKWHFYTHIIICVHYWRKFMNKFFIFSFKQFINKVCIIKFEVLCNFKMKYGLNKINNGSFTKQVRWLGSKKIQFHLWGPNIKLHKWHCCSQQWNTD
jgi:hypothetical protein